jgi:vancomycin resistance protein YoaR
MQGSTTAGRVRTREATVRGSHVRLLAGVAAVVAVALGFGLGFAGPPGKLADGVRIDGVSVGGLTPQAAKALLASRAASQAEVPVTFTAGSQTWQITPKELCVADDWSAAVDAAAGKGEGFGVLRGYRRLGLRLFGSDVAPAVHAYNSAVAYKVQLLARDIDRPHRDAALVRHGLAFTVTPARTGMVLDREAAAAVVVAALASSSRSPVELPVKVDRPRITPARLAQVRQRAARIVSAPVLLRIGIANFEVPRQKLAAMLRLPAAGAPALAIGGPAANAYFRKLDREVSTPAKDAGFVVGSDGKISISSAKPGVALDVPRTAAALLAAAERTRSRVGRIAFATSQPERSTAAARAMGITGTVASYETIYGGVANRIHNVQLVAKLIDGKLIAPGATFSFNEATGERTADKGFLEAPVIINGEVSTGLGGGICQVSTTVFNAAFEAGLPITERTNHALYISHYPLGRDATVNYPDVDLKFVNDTGTWLLLRTFVGPDSLVVNLYGTPQHRRVESETAPLRVVAQPPLEKKLDPSLAPGSHVVADYGVPAETTSVHRLVYSASGKLLSDATWVSNYVSSPKIVLIGPKKTKAKPDKAAKKDKAAAAAATTTTTDTTVTPTAPAPQQ